MTKKLSDCVCPECNQSDGLSIESSSELGVSNIYCSECEFSIQYGICEEDATEQFLQIYNNKKGNNNVQ